MCVKVLFQMCTSQEMQKFGWRGQYLLTGIDNIYKACILPEYIRRVNLQCAAVLMVLSTQNLYLCQCCNLYSFMNAVLPCTEVELVRTLFQT